MTVVVVSDTDKHLCSGFLSWAWANYFSHGEQVWNDWTETQSDLPVNKHWVCSFNRDVQMSEKKEIGQMPSHPSVTTEAYEQNITKLQQHQTLPVTVTLLLFSSKYNNCRSAFQHKIKILIQWTSAHQVLTCFQVICHSSVAVCLFQGGDINRVCHPLSGRDPMSLHHWVNVVTSSWDHLWFLLGRRVLDFLGRFGSITNLL